MSLHTKLNVLRADKAPVQEEEPLCQPSPFRESVDLGNCLEHLHQEQSEIDRRETERLARLAVMRDAD